MINLLIPKGINEGYENTNKEWVLRSLGISKIAEDQVHFDKFTV